VLQNKCTRYWPDCEDNKTYDKVHVLNLKESANPHYILREFLIHHEEEVGRLGRWGGVTLKEGVLVRSEYTI